MFHVSRISRYFIHIIYFNIISVPRVPTRDKCVCGRARAHVGYSLITACPAKLSHGNR